MTFKNINQMQNSSLNNEKEETIQIKQIREILNKIKRKTIYKNINRISLAQFYLHV